MSGAALRAVRLQVRAGHEQALEALRHTAYAEFLSAVDLFVRVMGELPRVPHELRLSSLDQKATAVVETLARVELLAPPAVATRARSLFVQCSGLEKLAMRRAVLRSAVQRLEANWCPRDIDRCQEPRHGSAFVAWELLTEWGRLEDEERWEKLDFLEFTLRESQALSAEEVKQVLDVANSVVHWSDMIGGWVRDPLLERIQAVRAEYVDIAYGSLHGLAV